MLQVTKQKPKNNKGFTLIELFLYISIAGVILLVISIFLATLLQARIKNQTISEVEQQGAQVMQLIIQAVRNAKGIDSPSQGASASLLSLDVFNSSNDPTIFDFSSGAIRITEGIGGAVDLTNSRLSGSGLSFQNLSKTDTPGAVKIIFTLTHLNPEGRNEYSFSKTFYGSASLRGGMQGFSLLQADKLVIDTSGANIGGGGNKELRGIMVENTGSGDIAIDKITLTWTNGKLIEEIKIEGARIWKHNNEGSPDGKQPTGTELDVVDYTILSGNTDTFDKFKFNGNMTGNTFDITFTLGDGSTKSTGSFSP
ncbi:MAG: hypothetical protein V3T98_02620 [Candidatus Paceibacterota bacterium]